MQLSDRGGQLALRPAPIQTIAPGWINNDLTQSTPPTIGDPDMMNGLLGEVLSLLTQTGQSPSKTSITQVLTAILALARFVDSGAVNALAIAPAAGIALPAPAALPDGTTFRIVPAATNTNGAPTLALWGNAPITITDPLGNALPVGAIAAGRPVEIMKAGGGAPVLWLLGAGITGSNFEIHPNGETEQWGAAEIVAAGGSVTVTLPIAFPTVVSSVLVTNSIGAGTTAQGASVGLLSSNGPPVTQLTFAMAGNVGNTGFYWRAWGR